MSQQPKVHTCLMMGEASLETSPKNNMIQNMINSDDIPELYWRDDTLTFSPYAGLTC